MNPRGKLVFIDFLLKMLLPRLTATSSTRSDSVISRGSPRIQRVSSESCVVLPIRMILVAWMLMAIRKKNWLHLWNKRGLAEGYNFEEIKTLWYSKVQSVPGAHLSADQITRSMCFTLPQSDLSRASPSHVHWLKGLGIPRVSMGGNILNRIF